MKKSWYFLAAIMLLSLSCARADYNDGLDAYSKGEYAQAMAHFKSCESDAMCAFGLGVMYDKGKGVAVDRSKAAALYAVAAAEGHSAAQFNLGLLCDRGDGVPQNYQEAVKWYKAAAAQGNHYAQNNLGILIANGLGGFGRSIKMALQHFYSVAHVNDDAKQNLALVSALITN